MKPLLSADGSGPGVLLIFFVLVLAGFLLGMLKPLKGRASLVGLGLGLVNGYVLSGFLLGKLLPESSALLPLPRWLTGSAGQPTPAATPSGPSLSSSLAERLIVGLNALADSGQIALVIAIVIAVFVLLATRLGSRSVKKG